MYDALRAIPVPTFERHNACLTCGYDLFGQPRSGTCPECGTSTRETARRASFLDSPSNREQVRSGSLLLLNSAILCGFCPGVCLLFMASEGHVLAAMAMTVAFAATAWTAERGERRFAMLLASDEPRDGDAGVEPAPGQFKHAAVGADDASRLRLDYEPARARPLFAGRGADVNAAIGLASINMAAYVYAAAELWDGAFVARTAGDDFVVALLIGVGFLSLSATAWRSVRAGRLRAHVADACLGPGHRGLVGLGWVKAVYETSWLSCCWLTVACYGLGLEDAAIFFALGAMFGLLGFAALWLVMIVLHAVLFAQLKRKLETIDRAPTIELQVPSS